MGKFTQLGLDFGAQERNWIKGGQQWYCPKNCVDSLEILRKHLVRRADSATTYSVPIADLDFHDFDRLVQWLPLLQRKIYIAENIRAYFNPKTGFKRLIPRDRNPWDFLGVSKFIYERTLNDAIANIKYRGELE